ncbi:MAG: transferrin-binding protein-like solute binding protein [Marinibacterium sp.]|nr:transferrin-binding protein-like solute binding protein [Marinibacterium sp.]
MNTATMRMLLAGAALAALSACGGGGGGGGGDAFTGVPLQPFQGNSNMPQDGATVINGDLVQMNVQAETFGGVRVSDRTETPTGSSVQILNEGGSPRAIKVTGGRDTIYADRNEGDTIDPSGTLISTRTANNKEAGFLANGPAMGLEHQTFGAWVTGLGGERGTAMAGSYGNRTAPAEIAGQTRAVYSGDSVGVGVNSFGTAGFTTSRVSVTTDFATADVRSRNTFLVPFGESSVTTARNLDFDASVPVSGNRFGGQVTGAGQLSGQVNGSFFGPNAAEVGGTFSVGGPDGRSNVGAFGAARRQ